MNNQRLSQIRAHKGYHILPIKPGQVLELHEKVGEWSNERIWKFKGLVIKVKKPNHVDGTFVIRWKVAGQTIEKIYPLSFTKFEKVILQDVNRVRRAKLYYLRDKVGKDARLKSISTAEDRWTDLLAVAVAEAKDLQAAVAPAVVAEAEPAPEQANEEAKDTPEAAEEKTEHKPEAEEKAEEAKEEEPKKEEAKQEAEEKQEEQTEEKE